MSNFDPVLLVMIMLSFLILSAFSLTVAFLLFLEVVISGGTNYGAVVFALLFGIMMLLVGKGALEIVTGGK